MMSAAKYRGLDFDRRKGRLICQGFRAIEGIHHDGKAFAASPSQYSQKLLMSFVAGKGYKIRSWDIKTAYLFGERVKPVCLSYPVGFRREKDGKELYMVARRGHSLRRNQRGENVGGDKDKADSEDVRLAELERAHLQVRSLPQHYHLLARWKTRGFQMAHVWKRKIGSRRVEIAIGAP